jgi:hypothetical protein
MTAGRGRRSGRIPAGGGDLAALIDQHRDALARYTGGVLPDTFLLAIRTRLEDLRRLYGLAADEGQAVVKRTYT